MKKILVLGLVMLFAQSVAVADSQILPDESSVVGTVNGKEVTLGEIQDKKIHELRSNLHKALENAFISEAIKRLKETNKEFEAISVPPIKEEDIRKFYVDNNLAMRGSYQDFAPQIRQYLKDMMYAREEYKLYKAAQEKGHASSKLVGPGPYIVSIPVETAFIQGAKTGPVMLLEFSDFQCPYCKKVQPSLRKLVKEYKDRVAFGYRHFPLTFHQDAAGASIAAECAREQGKFIEMHGRLFKQQKKQSNADLKKLAKDIGIKDLNKFNACLDGDKYRKLIERDIEVAESIGINGTPAFVIGKYDSKKGILKGEILSGALPVEIISETLERYLAK